MPRRARVPGQRAHPGRVPRREEAGLRGRRTVGSEEKAGDGQGEERRELGRREDVLCPRPGLETGRVRGGQERDQKARKRDLGIDGAHDEGIGPAAEIARKGAQDRPGNAGKEHDGDANEERYARSVDDPRQDITNLRRLRIVFKVERLVSDRRTGAIGRHQNP